MTSPSPIIMCIIIFLRHIAIPQEWVSHVCACACVRVCLDICLRIDFRQSTKLKEIYSDRKNCSFNLILKLTLCLPVNVTSLSVTLNCDFILNFILQLSYSYPSTQSGSQSTRQGLEGTPVHTAASNLAKTKEKLFIRTSCQMSKGRHLRSYTCSAETA